MFSTMGFQLSGIQSRERRDDRRNGFHVPVIVVDKVTEDWSVGDGKTETNTVLLNVWIELTWSMWRRGYGQRRGLFTGADALDGDGLGPFSIRSERLLGRIEHGIEKGVNQG